MNFSIRPSPTFIRQIKRLTDKYPKMIPVLNDYLQNMESRGVRGKIMERHNNLWKDRIALKPYGIGESGGLRIISYHASGDPVIIPVLLYSKREMKSPSKDLLKKCLKEVREIFLDIE